MFLFQNHGNSTLLFLSAVNTKKPTVIGFDIKMQDGSSIQIYAKVCKLDFI